MSAPQTNVEKQARSHRSVIWGIAIAVAFGLLMAALITFTGTSGEDNPDDATTTAVPEAQQSTN